jgi:hypothetical protein
MLKLLDVDALLRVGLAYVAWTEDDRGYLARLTKEERRSVWDDDTSACHPGQGA